MFYFGIHPFQGDIKIYDSKNKSIQNVITSKVRHFDINKVDEIFCHPKLKSIDKSLRGCACICLEENYGIEIRKKFLESSVRNGFEKIEIIDWQSSTFLNAIHQSNFKLKMNEIIWIFTGFSYHVWQYKSKKCKLIFSPVGYFSKVENPEVIKEKSKLNKPPNFILYKHDFVFDQSQFKEAFSKVEILPFKFSTHSDGALVKARITAKDSDVIGYDLSPIFDQHIKLSLGKSQILSFNDCFETLPLKKSIVIRKAPKERELTIENINNFYYQNSKTEIKVLPECQEICINFSAYLNGIYSIDYLALDIMDDYDENGYEKITHFVGADFLKGEVMSYEVATKKTTKNYLNNATNASRNVLTCFEQLLHGIPSPSTTSIIFHFDDECCNQILIELYSLAKQNNFQKIGFISTQAAELCNALSEFHLDKNVNSVAIITDINAKRKTYCQQWKKENNDYFSAAKNFLRFSEPGADEENLQKLKEESNGLKNVDMVFLNPLIDTNIFKFKFPNTKFQILKTQGSCAEAALEKAKWNFESPKIGNNLNRRISLLINNVQKINFSIGDKLPCQNELIIDEPDFKSYKICERTFGGIKYESEHCFPYRGKFKLTLYCNINGVYSVNYELMDSNGSKAVSPIEEQRSMKLSISNINQYIKSMAVFEDSTTEEYKFTIPKKIIANNEAICAVGIDLGTSRCCIAVNRKNGIETVPLDNKGERLLPSYVAYDEKNEKVGQVVIDRLKHYSQSTIFDSKRIIGKEFEFIKPLKSWPFDVVEDKNDNMQPNSPKGIPIIQTEFDKNKIRKYPEEVASALLKHLKQKAEEFQGKLLYEAVITVPASFSEAEKGATLVAAKLAGWETIHLLPEPVAAAFAYFIDREIPENSTSLIFDLGGGTLDICVFKIKNNEIQILNYEGERYLGGRDFDGLLVDHFKNAMITEYGIPEKELENKKYKLMLECQRIKEHLSVAFTEQLDISEFDTSQEGFISITRDTFENLCHKFKPQIQGIIVAALKNLKNNEIHNVLLVGGGCRMPYIQALLQAEFPAASLRREEHPDEVVAVGAAYYSYYLGSKQATILNATSK